jgi:hypothetical protein
VQQKIIVDRVSKLGEQIAAAQSFERAQDNGDTDNTQSVSVTTDSAASTTDKVQHAVPSVDRNAKPLIERQVLDDKPKPVPVVPSFDRLVKPSAQNKAATRQTENVLAPVTIPQLHVNANEQLEIVLQRLRPVINATDKGVRMSSEPGVAYAVGMCYAHSHVNTGLRWFDEQGQLVLRQ